MKKKYKVGDVVYFRGIKCFVDRIVSDEVLMIHDGNGAYFRPRVQDLHKKDAKPEAIPFGPVDPESLVRVVDDTPVFPKKEDMKPITQIKMPLKFDDETGVLSFDEKIEKSIKFSGSKKSDGKTIHGLDPEEQKEKVEETIRRTVEKITTQMLNVMINKQGSQDATAMFESSGNAPREGEESDKVRYEVIIKKVVQ